MILTDYYLLQFIEGQKSKLRRECIKSSQTYPAFEILRNKDGILFMYVTDVPDSFNSRAKEKASKSISKTKHISGIFFPDISQPFAYGNIKDTNDALLFICNPNFSTIEVFVARGQLHHERPLCTMLADGELNIEIEILRADAKAEK